jgi:hypothetical protein
MTDREYKLLEGFHVGTEKEMIRNRFSGQEIELSPEAVAIYDLLMGAELTLHNPQLRLGRPYEEIEDIFFAAKDVFLRNWPEAYMILVD